MAVGMRTGKDQRGFSLVELMTVVVIAGILIVVAMPNMIQVYRTNRLNSAISDVSTCAERARFEAVKLNRSIACRLLPGTPLTLFVDINGDSIAQNTEPTVVLGGEFRFNIAGTPAAGSMGVGVTAFPPGRITFTGRGVPDYSNTAPGMGFGAATPVLLTTLGNVNRPQDGFRALTISPVGKFTRWRAFAGGTWTHVQ
jgi:prepilin-type N-terminal cleavage/methylation domain-containing protein